MNNLLIGKAGEFRVASELLKRGISVYIPIIDNGVDLITSCGCRIQVKSAHKTAVGKYQKTMRYNFTFRHWSGKKGINRAKTLQNCSVVVLWGIEDDVFMVIPMRKIKVNQGISFSYGNNSFNKTCRSGLSKYFEAWELIT